MREGINIREATGSDIAALVDFYMRLDHSGQKEWIEILTNGRHPYVSASNFIIAEDGDIGKIVASAIYMPWTYSYNGCFLKAVRLEEVFCEPEYQNQGLMKKILNRISQISVEQGHLFETVYGTNAVYTHLGYTYGLPNEEEGYSYMLESEPVDGSYLIQEASDSDIPLIAELYKANYSRNLVATAIGCAELDYMKNIYVEGSFYVIKAPDGHICGFFHTQLDDKHIYMMEIDDTASYYRLRPYISEFYKRHGFDRIHFKLGKKHPVYSVFDGFYHVHFLSELGFVKVPDIPKFLTGISDVISARILKSAYAHYSGNLIMAMHNRDEAYELSFENGRLAAVSPASQRFGNVDIERDRFIKLLFGRISAEDMRNEHSMYFFENNDLRHLFEIMFPPMDSHVVSVN
jgi:GNAT superfamily N-acetyltransferase